MTGVRRLAPPQSRRVNALVRRECCNYDCGNCILLDDGDECVCPQTISFSLLCKWFRAAVLPLDKELYAALYPRRTGGVVPCAARPLRQAQTASNTARTAGNKYSADKPQNANGNSGYCHAVGAKKPLYNGAFRA